MHNTLPGKKQAIERLMNERLKLATVSGVLTTRPGIIAEVDRRLPAVEVITTKSYQLFPNPGNREPVIVETAPGNFGNAVGLRNPGMEQGIRELRELRRRHKFRSLLNVSISGSTPEEFEQLAEVFSEVADILELNLSCPHAAPGYGMSIGTDPALVAEYVACVRKVTDRPIFPKLTPNVDDIGEIAIAAVKAGADGICAINTVGPELYIEPHSGQPILMNQRGNRGGKSGVWIAETARKKVAEIRAAVGPSVPIIGIGGVSSGMDMAALVEAGANVVGIGSVFARVRPENWESFTSALVRDAARILRNESRARPRAGLGIDEDSTSGSTAHGGNDTADAAPGKPSRADASTKNDTAAAFLSSERLMEYKPYTVKRVETGGHGTTVLELDGELEYKSSQFAFLWLPGIGEKPFSIAHSSPLTFFIKDRGHVSGRICRLQPGEIVYVRGVYGRSAPLTTKKRAYILAGGTGIAVAHKLVKELADQGTASTIYYATSHLENVLVPPGLDETAELHVIPDDGQPARAIYEWQREIENGRSSQNVSVQTTEGGAIRPGGDAGENSWALYTIGPPDYMRRAVEIAEANGTDPEDIYLSVETATHCGVGLCGECECGGKLTCQEGTFFTKAFLDSQGIKVSELPSHSKHGVNKNVISIFPHE